MSEAAEQPPVEPVAKRRRRRPPFTAVFAVLLAGLLAGCGESNVTLSEPGVYKGSSDPLIAKLKTDELQQALRERFRRVQMAR